MLSRWLVTVFVISGGKTAAKGLTTSVYSLENNVWTELPPMAIERRYHSCAFFDDHIYVLGGKALKSTEILDLATNTWSFGPELPGTFKAGQAFTFQDALYAMDRLGTFLKLDDDKAGWSEVAAVKKTGIRLVYPVLVVDYDILHC